MTAVRGTYILVLTLSGEVDIAAGKLREFSFPAGYYLYIGSALKGLFSRLKRHIEVSKRRHWHIDYLREKAQVVEIWYLVSDERLECNLYRAAMAMPGSRQMIKGFGSSDCHCDSHLVYFERMPSFEAFKNALAEKGNDLCRLPVTGDSQYDTSRIIGAYPQRKQLS